MIAPSQRCISPREVETCAVLGYNKEGEYVHLDGCGYADESGKCHYRGIRKPGKDIQRGHCSGAASERCNRGKGRRSKHVQVTLNTWVNSHEDKAIACD